MINKLKSLCVLPFQSTSQYFFLIRFFFISCPACLNSCRQDTSLISHYEALICTNTIYPSTFRHLQRYQLFLPSFPTNCNTLQYPCTVPSKGILFDILITNRFPFIHYSIPMQFHFSTSSLTIRT